MLNSRALQRGLPDAEIWYNDRAIECWQDEGITSLSNYQEIVGEFSHCLRIGSEFGFASISINQDDSSEGTYFKGMQLVSEPIEFNVWKELSYPYLYKGMVMRICKNQEFSVTKTIEADPDFVPNFGSLQYFDNSLNEEGEVNEDYDYLFETYGLRVSNLDSFFEKPVPASEFITYRETDLSRDCSTLQIRGSSLLSFSFDPAQMKELNGLSIEIAAQPWKMDQLTVLIICCVMLAF
jgi:hypothetical protein